MGGRRSRPRRSVLKAGVDYERSIVREAWESGLLAVRAAGSGSGTSAYPKPDIIIFGPDGVVDVVQVKTTRRTHLRLTPEAWRNEVLAAERLRDLGFKARVWLAIKIIRPGGSEEARIRVDGHEDGVLIVDLGPNGIGFKWVEERENK